MITNNKITYYSKSINSQKNEVWTRTLLKDVWVFGGLGSNINKGYADANNVDVRIPLRKGIDVKMFKIGDIVAIGETPDIEKQADLRGSEFYNVTSINVNDFGHNPHIHLGGK